MTANYETAWSPREYLAQYYSNGVSSDEQHILAFIANFLKTHGNFTSLLEVGCGPTIHHIAPFAFNVDGIYMADYLESNLQEIYKWVRYDRDAHNWNAFLEEVLFSMDSSTTPALLAHTLRTKMLGLCSCNILAEKPLPAVEKTFDLVTSFYCLECVSSSKTLWHQAMQNLSSLVEPGGSVILSALRNADQYIIGDGSFPTVCLTGDDVRDALIDNGFTESSMNLEIHESPEWASSGFESIIICSAQKEV